MRDIKFRGKSGLGEGNWVIGSLVRDKDKETQFGEAYILPEGWSCLEEDIEPVGARTVGQFTELKDCNRKDICEGDVVSYEYYGETKFGYVVLSNGEFDIKDCYDATTLPLFFFGDVCGFTSAVVVGNIHDNPEMVKGEEK